MSKFRYNNKKHELDDSEENLRGLVRKLQKQLEKEKRYSKSLEKKIERASQEKPQKRDENKKQSSEIVCPECGKGKLEMKPVWHPTKEIYWMSCNLCKFKERMK